jgi:hypothetical protein
MGVAVSTVTIMGTLEAVADGLLFQCDLSGRIVQCGIAESALRDLLDIHRLNNSEDVVLRTVLLEMQRIVTAKWRSGRFEENGCLIIWPVDLLRYGYWRRVNSAA